MIKLKYSWNAFLVMVPIIFLEWRQLDIITFCFMCWTFVDIYYLLQVTPTKPIVKNYVGYYSGVPAAFILAAYLLAAIDVRFIHLSDDISSQIRYKAVIAYALLTIAKLLFTDIYYKTNSVDISNLNILKNRFAAFLKPLVHFVFSNSPIIPGIIYLISSVMLVLGQIAMNSGISVIVIIPAAALSILGLVKQSMCFVETFSEGSIDKIK